MAPPSNFRTNDPLEKLHRSRKSDGEAPCAHNPHCRARSHKPIMLRIRKIMVTLQRRYLLREALTEDEVEGQHAHHSGCSLRTLFWPQIGLTGAKQFRETPVLQNVQSQQRNPHKSKCRRCTASSRLSHPSCHPCLTDSELSSTEISIFFRQMLNTFVIISV